MEFVGHLLPQAPPLDLQRIMGRDLQEVARVEKSTAGGLDGGVADALVFWSGCSSGIG